MLTNSSQCNLARQAVQGKLGVKYQLESSRRTCWHVGLEFRKQQVAGSIPITGSIFRYDKGRDTASGPV